MSKFVKFHDLDSTRIITIDKPETKNALTSGMLSTISEIIRNSEELTQIRSIIITSNCEKIFSSGYDISSKNLDNKEDLLKIHVIGYQKQKHPLMEASETIRDSSKIIIAAINGHIFGGTLEVLLNCDFKFLSKECYFCMPPAKLGIAYNYNGIKNFINKIGVVNTKKIFLTADKFNSSEALNMGLVDFLSSHDEVITDSIELGKKIHCIKRNSFKEDYFRGHFPNNPVMPGVIILEALAQASGILGFKTMNKTPEEGSIYVFAGVDKARFRSRVGPEDVLHLHSEVVNEKKGIWKFETKAFVDDRLVCTATILCADRKV